MCRCAAGLLQSLLQSQLGIMRYGTGVGEGVSSNRFEDGSTPVPTCSRKRQRAGFEFRLPRACPDVLYYSGNTGQDIPAATRIWNPTTREVREPPNAPETDVFCSGLTPLWDGRLFVVGGTKLYPTDTNPFVGSKAAYTIDPIDGWQRVPDMTFGRWYPSAIMMADGRVLVVSGATDDGGITPRIEIFNQLEGWELPPEEAGRLLPLYPRMHVLPGGEIACLGNGQDLIFFNPETQGWREIGAAGEIPDADDDLAVLLAPAQSPKILHAGGGGAADGEPGIARAHIIDLTDSAPAFREIAPLANPRWFPNSALLPDGTLFVVGGGRVHGGDPVMEPEIFDPDTEAGRRTLRCRCRVCITPRPFSYRMVEFG